MMEAAEPVGAPTLIQNSISAMASGESLGAFWGITGSWACVTSL